MAKQVNTVPFNSDLPSKHADMLGTVYSRSVNSKHKKENGQFFTPQEIAKLMASYSNFNGKTIRILDPGCGTLILSCSLIEKLTLNKSDITSIELIAYETDSELIPYAEKSIFYLEKWLAKKNITFKSSLRNIDFVLDNAKVLTDNSVVEKFDVIISNPPYFKLSKNDEKAILAKKLVNGQPNIYSIFMGIASKLLNENGELIFITPRSFASGNYFKTFRDFFFKAVQLDIVHLFNSRKDTFSRDNVLQETVIIKAINERIDPNKKVIISSSSGIKDIFNPNIRFFKSSEIINHNSEDKILHLPINKKEEGILKLIEAWENNLSNYNIQISTGPVVSFRSLEYIQNNFENKTAQLVPLFWLHNVNKMILEWPKQLKDKGQFISIEEKSKSMLILNKNYIFLRRFSSKDDKSRLIAAPYFCNYINGDYIGVENKLNYIYRKNGHLTRNETVGLCALLNSEFFDTYFQIFNGNVNVSATELRGMKLPPLNIIEDIGDEIILTNDYTMTNTNRIINKKFGLKEILKNE